MPRVRLACPRRQPSPPSRHHKPPTPPLRARAFLSLQAGLIAAAFIAIVPGYISRSVAGSYDNEGIAIFCLLLTYTCWIKSVKTGSLFWVSGTALAYFYMVSAWGGYIFIINLIPLYVFVMLLSGRCVLPPHGLR